MVVIDRGGRKAPRRGDQTSRPWPVAGEGGTWGGTASRSRLRGIAEAEESGQGEEGRQRVRALREAALPVDQVRAHAERPRAVDVVERRVPDHDGGSGLDTELLERRAEDRRARLHLPVDDGRDPRVHVEREVADQGGPVPARV